MKQVLFCAVALLMFSFAGMANNKSVMKSKVQRNSVLVTACVDFWMGHYWGQRDTGATDQEAMAYANSRLSACEQSITSN